MPAPARPVAAAVPARTAGKLTEGMSAAAFFRRALAIVVAGAARHVEGGAVKIMFLGELRGLLEPLDHAIDAGRLIGDRRFFQDRRLAAGHQQPNYQREGLERHAEPRGVG